MSYEATVGDFARPIKDVRGSRYREPSDRSSERMFITLRVCFDFELSPQVAPNVRAEISAYPKTARRVAVAARQVIGRGSAARPADAVLGRGSSAADENVPWHDIAAGSPDRGWLPWGR